ncbi:DUF5313 family protein [Gordonia neofelifaecis]|uniref:Integral membrane protein n=1 Tax=Gordonia neofelifaecis NRRL B-59395 TaxID=644548 RepID=F1YN34_9ACTN|nr:DUF5313 family protein [Gordonia neofelifaecis]EGD53921.1 integral membrane protein [Gordonia neofelifaecis NRRL B-59395]
MSGRPNPVQWVVYAYGGTLPADKREWVRNDLTGRTATLRHLFRAQFCFTPLYLVMFFAFDGEVWIRGLMVLLAVLLALIFSAAYMDQNRVLRLRKHDLGHSPLTQRQQIRADREKVRYEAVYAERRA